MVCTSTIGVETVNWLRMVELVVTGAPSTTSPTRNVVPPMSVEMMLWVSSSAASRVQPTTPPVSTEPMVVTAWRGASPELTHPPEPCMISS